MRRLLSSFALGYGQLASKGGPIGLGGGHPPGELPPERRYLSKEGPPTSHDFPVGTNLALAQLGGRPGSAARIACRQGNPIGVNVEKR